MRLLRRKPAPPGADDARALAAAARRIVELETRLTTQTARADRASCGRFCAHAAQLADAQWSLFLAEQGIADRDERLRAFLGRLYDLTAPIPPAEKAG